MWGCGWESTAANGGRCPKARSPWQLAPGRQHGQLSGWASGVQRPSPEATLRLLGCFIDARWRALAGQLRGLAGAVGSGCGRWGTGAVLFFTLSSCSPPSPADCASLSPHRATVCCNDATGSSLHPRPSLCPRLASPRLPRLPAAAPSPAPARCVDDADLTARHALILLPPCHSADRHPLGFSRPRQASHSPLTVKREARAQAAQAGLSRPSVCARGTKTLVPRRDGANRSQRSGRPCL